MKPNLSFRRFHRLTEGDEFTQIFRLGRRRTYRPFVLLWRPNADGTPRLGIAVAKRLIRLATDRNRIKRIIRESFRQNRKALPPADIVIQVTRGANSESSAVLSDALTHLWETLSRHPNN